MVSGGGGSRVTRLLGRLTASTTSPQQQSRPSEQARHKEHHRITRQARMRVDARAAMAVAILVQFVVILALLTVSWSGASCKGVEVCGGVLGGSLVQSAPIPRWKTSLTISRKPLFQSSRARIECHDVMIDGKRINDCRSGKKREHRPNCKSTRETNDRCIPSLRSSPLA